MKENKKKTYTGDNIKVLEGLEAVRVRPGMYIGSTGERGLHHLLWEVVDNSVDEHLAGYTKNITITIFKDGCISVEDDGRGIPVDIHKEAKRPTVEVLLTVLHSGGKFDNDSYKFSGGLHGVGISVVNALSEFVEVTIGRNKKVYQQTFSKGKVMSDLKIIGNSNKTGTTIKFKPDPTIFETTEFNLNTIVNRVNEIAYLNEGLTFIIKKEGSKEMKIRHKNGLMDYIKESKKKFICDPIQFNYSSNEFKCDIVMAYDEGNSVNEISFVNSIRTIDGGTHITGFRTGLTKVINDLAREKGFIKDKDPNFNGNDIREGINVILHMKLLNPQFESQTKDKLGSVEATQIAYDAVMEHLKPYLINNSDVFVKIINRIKLTTKARLAAKHARDMIMNKSKNPIDDIGNSKLSDCTSKKPEERELFICEGLSAGGSAKQCRDRYFQAILPIKGKILNIEKADISKVSQSDEIKSVINALGCGMGKDFNIDNLRFHKIVIMTDADYDGLHIRALLITLFHSFVPELLNKGHIYVATPPLFKLTHKNKIYYVENEAERDKLLKKFGDNVNIQRFKGLGEMNPEQLWETTMNPKTRTLLQVINKNKKNTKRAIDTFMGKNIEDRRVYIDKHGSKLNIDEIL